MDENREHQADLHGENGQAGQGGGFPDDIQEISLRDYFAAQALAAIVDAAEDEMEGEDFGEFAFECAKRSYALADAMMIARELEFIEVEEEDDEEEDGEDEEEGEEGGQSEPKS